MIAFRVAAKKKSVKTSNPVKAKNVIVPTCHKIVENSETTEAICKEALTSLLLEGSYIQL